MHKLAPEAEQVNWYLITMVAAVQVHGPQRGHAAQLLRQVRGVAWPGLAWLGSLVHAHWHANVPNGIPLSCCHPCMRAPVVSEMVSREQADQGDQGAASSGPAGVLEPVELTKHLLDP